MYFLRKLGGFNYFSYLCGVNLTQDMNDEVEVSRERGKRSVRERENGYCFVIFFRNLNCLKYYELQID